MPKRTHLLATMTELCREQIERSGQKPDLWLLDYRLKPMLYDEVEDLLVKPGPVYPGGASFWGIPYKWVDTDSIDAVSHAAAGFERAHILLHPDSKQKYLSPTRFERSKTNAR